MTVRSSRRGERWPLSSAASDNSRVKGVSSETPAEGGVMRRGLLFLVLGVSVIIVPVAYALLAQQGVRTSSAQEITPAAGFTPSGVPLFAWSQNSSAHPNHFNAYFKRGSHARVRLNPTGRGYLGGINPPYVVYQHVRRGESNVKFFNYRTGVRSSPPSVNTADWEWSPSMSGAWILFGRDDDESNDQWVLLQSRSSSTQVQLDMVDLSTQQLYPGQVSGDFAAWTRCGLTCEVTKYQISNGLATPLAKPADAINQYAAAVTSTGTVYLVRSGDGCGVTPRVVRYGPADPAEGTVIASLGSGRDAGGDGGYVRERGDGSVEFFYDRYVCSSGRWDIYKVTDPAP
jgi:hypothetical protein